MTNTNLFYTRRLLILTICILFIIFLSMEVYGMDFSISSNVLKFFSIFLCFIVSIISNPLQNQSRNVFLLQLGIIFTLMADYVFLIHNNNYPIAVGLFSIVQIVYSLRYREGNELVRILRFIFIYLVIVIIHRVLNRTLIEIDFLIALGIFYGICLISSVKEAFGRYKTDDQDTNRMILFGMMLFLLCDMSLGLNYILDGFKNTGHILNFLKSASYISIWIYYLPSQILLALSGVHMRN